MNSKKNIISIERELFMAWKGDEWEGRFDSVTCCLKGPRSLLMSGILTLILTNESV